MPLQTCKRKTIVKQGARIVVLCFQCRPEQLQCLVMPTLLTSQNAQEVPRMKIIGIHSQESQIYCFRMREVSLLVQRQRLTDRVG